MPSSNHRRNQNMEYHPKHPPCPWVTSFLVSTAGDCWSCFCSFADSRMSSKQNHSMSYTAFTGRNNLYSVYYSLQYIPPRAGFPSFPQTEENLIFLLYLTRPLPHTGISSTRLWTSCSNCWKLPVIYKILPRVWKVPEWRGPWSAGARASIQEQCLRAFDPDLSHSPCKPQGLCLGCVDDDDDSNNGGGSGSI